MIYFILSFVLMLEIQPVTNDIDSAVLRASALTSIEVQAKNPACKDCVIMQSNPISKLAQY